MKELGISRLVTHGRGECVEDIEEQCEDEAGRGGGPDWQHLIPEAALQTNQGAHHVREPSYLAENCPRAVRLLEADEK